MVRSSIIFFIIFSFLVLFSCSKDQVEQENFNVDESIVYCSQKLQLALKHFNEAEGLPRYINQGEIHWNGNSINNWTSGFFPGMLWTMYEATGDDVWLQNARYYTNLLKPIRHLPWKTHDFGFMMYYSYGLGFELTNDMSYRDILLELADSLATLFNPKVGTMESWPWMKRRRNWPHTTIIDNMMNLELLFWAAKNGGNSEYRKIAEVHALKTMEDFIRPDNSTNHIVVYDSISPAVLLKTTDQGYDSSSTWARGHSWGTYGFAKAYKYTGNKKFLEVAENMAIYYLDHVDEDMIPYWDFNDPDIPNAKKDASAAAIMSCALLVLSELSDGSSYRQLFHTSATNILRELSSDRYLADDRDAFLKNSINGKASLTTGSSSHIYTDYFYLEALVKLREIDQGSHLTQQD